MSINGGTIFGRAWINWTKGASDVFVAMSELKLGDSEFPIRETNAETKTSSDGYFAIPFTWDAPRVGQIDKNLKAKIILFDRSNRMADKLITSVGLYVSLGKIWKGQGGLSLMAIDGVPDAVGSWTIVHETVRKLPIPRILSQTGMMSTELYGLVGCCQLTMSE